MTFCTGLFAEIVVDAVDLGLGQDLPQFLVELFRGGQVMAEGFFDNHANQPPLSSFDKQHWPRILRWEEKKPAARPPGKRVCFRACCASCPASLICCSSLVKRLRPENHLERNKFARSSTPKSSCRSGGSILGISSASIFRKLSW